MRFDKRYSNLVTKWWFSLDHAVVFSVILLMFFGAVVVTTASPYVAEKLGLDSFYFSKRHLVFSCISLCVMIGFSLLQPVFIRRLAFFAMLGGLGLLVILLLLEPQLKGAKRWISLGGFSLQPSEIIKPFFVVLNAWFLSQKLNPKAFSYYMASVGLYLFIILLLILQPDFGMSVNYSIIWISQVFLAGISTKYLLFFAIFAILIAVSAYISFEHVHYRIDAFLFSEDNVNYQIIKSLQSFANGGFWGRGILEGDVKKYLPDSHTDFIFAVIGEEFGFIGAFVIIALYSFIIWRLLQKLQKLDNNFQILALAGLIIQFAFQIMVNIGVNLSLLPTKGATLPFISYGGSSLIAMGALMGMIFAFSRDSYGKTLNNTKYL
jgi:cell division protein FtsW